MSGLDLLRDADLQTEREVAREPAKRWRNKWRSPHGFLGRGICHRSGEHLRADERGIVWSPVAWPSKELAEEAALRATEMNIADGRLPLPEYLGAFPADETP